MNETELREGLREVIAGSNPPPSMDAARALEVARQARSRRRATWAGAGAAAGVVTIAVTATVALSGGWQPGLPAGTGGGPRGTAAPPGTAAPLGTAPLTDTDSPSGGETRTPWPTGPDGQPQQDRTAYAGPRYDVGARLLDELIAVVPPGHTVPQTQPPQPTGAVSPGELTPDNDPSARYHQAQFADRVDGVEVWEYSASLAVRQGDAAGRLVADVYTPGNGLPTDPCQLATSWWGAGGGCQAVDVDGQRVGLVTGGTGEFDEWAAYRHADGTVVFIAQSRHYRGAAAALPQPLFTTSELAELATSERFRVS